MDNREAEQLLTNHEILIDPGDQRSAVEIAAALGLVAMARKHGV